MLYDTKGRRLHVLIAKRPIIFLSTLFPKHNLKKSINDDIAIGRISGLPTNF